jgi:hypothetical protein
MADPKVQTHAKETQAVQGRRPTAPELRRDGGGAPETPGALFALWFSLLGPPVAWAAQLVLSDGFAELGCRAGGFATQRLVLLAITVVTAAVSVFAGIVAVRALQALRAAEGHREAPGDQEGEHDREARGDGETWRQRTEFMAEGGVVSSVLFTVLIVMGGVVPHLILRVCGA